MPAPVPSATGPPSRTRSSTAVADGALLLAVAALVTAAALAGRELIAAGVNIVLPFPPLLAEWLPHIGPGTPLAVVVALAVVARGPELAQRLGWGRLLGAGYVTAVTWTLALALVDGWQRGVVERLTSRDEYLHDVGRVTDIPLMLRTFTEHILTDRPGFWTTHVGAHPPGVFLVFVWLDRLGWGGGGPAGVVAVLVGASACVAVAVTLGALGAEDTARRVLPFGVLLPGAVWMGVSADGMFAGVLAWGVAGLTIGATRRGRVAVVAAVAGGVALGYCLYLSYGLVLAGLLPVAALLAARGRDRVAARRAAGLGVAGVLLVVAAFTVSGFWWPDGFADLRVIYAAGVASTRPYSYFAWADLAAAAFALGPAVLVGLRRAAAAPATLPRPALLLAAAALLAVVIADLSGMSKGEVERIWLPFAVWLVLPCALLGRFGSGARGWLAAQAVLALAVNHLLLTTW
jgi:hypothetical protein